MAVAYLARRQSAFCVGVTVEECRAQVEECRALRMRVEERRALRVRVGGRAVVSAAGAARRRGTSIEGAEDVLWRERAQTSCHRQH